jgi:RimJ/RimL family protein N-acetyltransferase
LFNLREMRRAECTTERLNCRAPGRRDHRGYRALLLDPLVAAALFPPPLAPYGPREVARLLRADVEHWNRHGFGPWALIDRATGAYVGRGGLAWTTVAGRRAVELPWSIVPGRWGEGLATEAGRAALTTARELGLREVVSFTAVGNHASRRVMEKIGLVREAEVEHAGLPHVLFGATTGSARPDR